MQFSANAFAVLVAFLLGGAIGAEREWRRHPGGLRTFALVAAAACVFARIAVGHGGTATGAALGAITSGVGFLGAGVILHQGAAVTGLSTAATFWAVAGIGSAVGLAEYGLGLALAALVLAVQLLLRPLSDWIDRHAPPRQDGPK